MSKNDSFCVFQCYQQKCFETPGIPGPKGYHGPKVSIKEMELYPNMEII